MPIQKQNLSVNFGGNIDTKTDPFQIAPNDFLAFNNSVRTVGGQLKKRFGFQNIASFNSPFATNLAIFSGALIGIGSSVQVYSPDTNSIFSRGDFQPIGLSTIPAIRNSSTQSSADVGIAPNGLACTVCAQSSDIIYQILDSITGNVLVPLTIISGASVARVFILGSNFIITYFDGSSLVYKAIPWSTPATTPTSGTLVSSPHSSVYDGFSFNSNLFFASNNSNNSIRIDVMNSALSITTGNAFGGLASNPLLMSVTVDATTVNPNIWITISTYVSMTHTAAITTYAVSFNAGSFTNLVVGASLYSIVINPNSIVGLTSAASGGTLTAIVGLSIVSIFPSNATIVSITCTNASAVGTPTSFIYNLFIAGKAFISPVSSSNIYFLTFYSDIYQPTYFLVDILGNILAKIAYSNGGTPNASVFSSPNQNGNTVQYAYLYQDLIAPVNKSNGAEPGGIYNQAGCNIMTLTFNESNIISAELGGSLQISGGFLWMYDGENAVENNFHVWPDPITLSSSSSGGHIDSANQPYFYAVCYEWTDAAGNIHRSAPSIPVEIDGLTGNTNTITVDIPPLGFTAKVDPNPVRLVVYRWSTVNQIYYQTSSISSPVINDPASVGLIDFVDTQADEDIIGNNILYTTGGIIENIGGPATELMALFDNRLWLVDAEDPNLLWFSKQVIEAVPVEMSDLLTFYVSPTTASQVSTGPITSITAMDDKLIIFKKNAIYYINGSGPDNTGANNQYSQPIFITAAVGCNNQKSIVLTPSGLIFQSGQGFWRLGRDLSTVYIGSPVEAYNSNICTSAVSVPSTTQIRFTLNDGVALVYDYFYERWDTTTPPTTISSVIYQGLQTLLDSSGNIWQENSSSYLDGINPVNMSFTTPWYNLAGLQGYERAYYCYLLGSYLSPHVLTVQIKYDYSQSVAQTVILNPNLLNPQGTGPVSSLEQFKIYFRNQKCQAVQMTVIESYNPSFGGTAGAGLTLSGINFVLGIKKSYKPISAAQSAG